MTIFQENAFGLQTLKGTTSTGISFSKVPAKILPASTNSLYGGTAVKLVDSTLQEIVVDKAAATDKIFGYVEFNRKGGSLNGAFTGNDNVDIVMMNAGNIMRMEANAAIATGSLLEIVASGDKVITNAGTNKIAGRALKKATASGDIIDVELITINI